MELTYKESDLTKKVIHCGLLIDGVLNSPTYDQVILIEGDEIVMIGGKELYDLRKDFIQDAQKIDLSNYCVLPGLVDCHSHPLTAVNDYQIQFLKDSSAFKALRGLKALQDGLLYGWTSVRIAGDADVFYGQFDIRRAINEGLFVGPRITGAGHYISITGGGGDINMISSEHHCKGHLNDGLIINGAEEMRVAIRKEVKFGSDWIKLLVTGAFMSANDDPECIHLSNEELQVAKEECIRLKKNIMAHAHSAEGIKQAIKYGARSIEHGSFIDSEGIQMMLQNDVFLVPTVYIGEYYEQLDKHQTSTVKVDKKMLEYQKRIKNRFLECIRSAHKSGVKIAVGSDFGVIPELHYNEISVLVNLIGMSNIQAIKSATSVGGELLGWKVGKLQKGYFADLIAVKGDPSKDIDTLSNVEFVMLGGRIVKNQTKCTKDAIPKKKENISNIS